MQGFNIGDKVRVHGVDAGTIVELPDPNRQGATACWLIQFDDKTRGHDGLGYARIRGHNLYWVFDKSEMTMISRAVPLTPFLQDVQDYIDREMKELQC